MRAAARRGPRFPGLLTLAAAVCVASLVAPSLASSTPYKPPKKKVWMGVSDTGNIADYDNFVSDVGKHVPVMQTFHAWGTKPGGPANARWDAAKVRPMLHISTAEGGGPELISPGQIAAGEGDDYLIRLNQYFGGTKQKIAYIRPFGEMNGFHNPYCAYGANGHKRDANHSTTQFKRAWKRIVIIVRGGGRLSEINARLAGEGLAPLNPQDAPAPPPLPGESEPYFQQAPVSFVWTPQLRNEPNVKGNHPSAYWPGKQWVDWTGTDIFSNSANFKSLNDFYKHDRHGKPFVIGEWSVALSDSAGFVKSLIGWTKSHKAVRMLVYYQGFGSDPYRPSRYPKTMSRLRRMLHPSRFPAFTPENSF
jgi:hypothetical protein